VARLAPIFNPYIQTLQADALAEGSLIEASYMYMLAMDLV